MAQLAESLARLGTESAFDVLARANQLQQKGKPVINLGIGQPDFPTPDHVVEAAIKALRDGHHGYTPAGGILPLREAVARMFAARYGVTYSPGQVLITPGAKVIMYLAIMMFGEKGREIIYPDPGFPIYRSLIDYSGATPVPFQLVEGNDFALQPDQLLDLVSERTSLVIINSPSNPTGGVANRDALARLADGLSQHPHVMVLSDEIYDRILFDGHKACSLAEFEALRDQLIILNGWSKSWAMTGWRLGFGLWPQWCIEPATRLCINIHSCVNAAAQWAGIAALEGPQDRVEAMVESFQLRRDVITDRLNALPM
ncbi:MAG: aminotransferase class I/II-fold pyridoxal phosphate-dependent enzyme, partial [Pseudomonadota bacterium]